MKKLIRIAFWFFTLAYLPYLLLLVEPNTTMKLIAIGLSVSAFCTAVTVSLSVFQINDLSEKYVKQKEEMEEARNTYKKASDKLIAYVLENDRYKQLYEDLLKDQYNR